MIAFICPLLQFKIHIQCTEKNQFTQLPRTLPKLQITEQIHPPKIDSPSNFRDVLSFLSSPNLSLRIFLYIFSNMCQIIDGNAQNQQNNQPKPRIKHLQSFFKAKQTLKCMSRQTLFLGIAICDKYFESLIAKKNEQNTKVQTQTRVATCIWIAWKFIQTDKIPVKVLVRKLEKWGLRTQSLIDMELDILESISFEIPFENTYASLIQEFESYRLDRRIQVVIAGQCLKFLREALAYSADFSLCCELGPEILRLYREHQVEDARIASVYTQIRHKAVLVNAVGST